jgi:predicted DNA-binding protein YlxM (UPF0122 family)
MKESKIFHQKHRMNTTNKPMAKPMSETEYIQAFFQCGLPVAEIAQMYGKSKDAIWRIIRYGK